MIRVVHVLAEDTDEGAVGRLAGEGVARLECLLGSYAAFEEYLANQDPTSQDPCL